jgi:dipeptidyl aminopeptidase/acylaminoacyl peptidase
MIRRMIGVAVVAAAACAAAVPASATPPGANGDIFYNGLSGGSNQGIWRVHPDGTGAQQLPLGALAVDARVSPDGTRLLYAVFGQPTDFLANADGSGSHAVPFYFGAWYPNGSQVVFSHAAHRRAPVHLFRENLDGTGLKKLTTGKHKDGYATVSPDGTTIAFVRDGGMLMRMPAAGGTPTRIGSDVLPYGADWSPDGTRLVYECWNPFNPTVVCVINADGSNRHVIWQMDRAAASAPVWSPDGTQVTFSVEAASHASIWRVNADGSDPQPVTTTPGDAASPSWQPLTG